MKKNTQLLHISTNHAIVFNNSKIKFNLSYKTAPVGVEGQIFNINLYRSKFDQHFPGEMSLEFYKKIYFQI